MTGVRSFLVCSTLSSLNLGCCSRVSVKVNTSAMNSVPVSPPRMSLSCNARVMGKLPLFDDKAKLSSKLSFFAETSRSPRDSCSGIFRTQSHRAQYAVLTVPISTSSSLSSLLDGGVERLRRYPTAKSTSMVVGRRKSKR